MGTKKEVQSKENPLSSQEVDAIIRSCRENGVTSLKVRDLEITFSQPVKVSEDKKPTPEVSVPVPEMTDAEIKIKNREALEHDEVSLKEDRIANLLITDPLKYEQMLLDGELEDDDGPGDDIGDAQEA